MYFHLTKVSKNTKTGPMPVATISKDTCPTSCPFNNGGGCYAALGPLRMHWEKVSSGERGKNFDEFLKEVKRLPDGIWRYGQAGDLPGVGEDIDGEQLKQLARANRGRPVIAYTHKPVLTREDNAEHIRVAEQSGFHINISTESLEQCDQLIEAGFSAVTVVPAAYQRGKEESLQDYKDRIKDLRTPKGTKVAICPATYTETNCQQCGACSKRRAADTVIAFPAHGSKKRTVDGRIGNAAVPALHDP